MKALTDTIRAMIAVQTSMDANSIDARAVPSGCSDQTVDSST